MPPKAGGNLMTNDDRRLYVESIAEMRELKGELREFKEHVMGRVQRLEKKEGERAKERLSVFSIIIAFAALTANIIINLFKR